MYYYQMELEFIKHFNIHHNSQRSVLVLSFLFFFRSKTEGADKFWASLEPYFADITENDLHNLQTQNNVRKIIH